MDTPIVKKIDLKTPTTDKYFRALCHGLYSYDLSVMASILMAYVVMAYVVMA